MKKTLLICSFALFVCVAQATQLTNVVNVPTAGSLKSLLSATDKSAITNLTVTGNIDVRDVVCLRADLPNLAVLDLSAVTISGYTGTDGTMGGSNTYPANEFPGDSFTGVTTLKSIIFPKSITSIGSYSFINSGLTGVLTIPENVTTISDAAFSTCTGLTEVNVGSKITTIGSDAFSYCQFTKFSIASTVPPVITSYVFSSTNNLLYSLCTLYVPTGKSVDYKTANYWKLFGTISEKVFNTATTDIAADNTKIYFSNNELIVEGVAESEMIKVYSANGMLLKSIKSQGLKTSVPISLKGFYLVKTPGKSQKISL